MTASAPSFFFRFYRFVGPTDKRTTELVRNQTEADGMRALIDQSETTVQMCINRVIQWAKNNGIAANAREPFPSKKYPGKVWVEFRFGGLML